jgi:hypothetical protein
VRTKEDKTAESLLLAVERPAPSAEGKFGAFVAGHRLGRVVEKGVSYKIILVFVVPSYEHNRQRPYCAGSCGCTVLAFINELSGLLVPRPNMKSKPATCFIGEFNQNGCNPYFDGFAVRVQVVATMKVVLVDNWPSVEALRPQSEIQGFAHSGFANIVSTDQ